MKVLKGTISAFGEQGSEGHDWIFSEDGKKGWEGFHMLASGDHLTVFDEGGSVLFKGVISKDSTVGRHVSPVNPHHSRPAALGFWIRWTQRGWKPDDWARLFIRYEGEKYLRAHLVKAKEWREANPKPKKGEEKQRKQTRKPRKKR